MAKTDVTDVAQLEAQIADLQQQLEVKNGLLKAADEALEQMQAKLNEFEKGLSGWLVKTPEANFSGMTAGVFFRKGMAFIPASVPNAEALARTMKNEFDYQVDWVRDYRTAIPDDNPTKRSLIDTLMLPQVM